jgi:hypothetical protein
MIMLLKSLRGRVLALLLAGVFVFACASDSTNTHGDFDIYGRIIWRAPLTGRSLAEFYLFHKEDGITDALILVDGDTIPEVSVEGRYAAPLIFNIGDTLEYSIVSTYGSATGSVIIPDTVQINRPTENDTLYTGINIFAAWNRGFQFDGYFAHLTNQDGFVASVRESVIDTTVEIGGQYVLNLGPDTFWVESLKGSFYDAYAPNGMNLPKGIVGASANFRRVNIEYAR